MSTNPPIMPIGFEPDSADVNPDPGVSSADADKLASGVDPEELGLDDDATPADADADADSDAHSDLAAD